jgi:hypothetical protein
MVIYDTQSTDKMQVVSILALLVAYLHQRIIVEVVYVKTKIDMVEIVAKVHLSHKV